MSWREAARKPEAKPAAPKPKFDTADDDWDTDPSFQNNVTEKSQRYGSSSIPGSGRLDHIDLSTVRDKAKVADEVVKTTYKDKNPNRGYGGKFGVEQVMDKSATDFAYKADATKHSSQTDSAKGYGGTYGVDQNVQDKSAVGFSHKEEVPKHSSQKDYSAGFGGKYGVQKEEPSRLAATPAPAPKPSPAPVATAPKVAEKPTSPAPVAAEPKVAEKPTSLPVNTGASGGSRISDMKAKFENMKKEQEAEAARRVAEERKKRETNEKKLQASQEKQESPKTTAAVSKEKPREPSPPPQPKETKPREPEPEPEPTTTTNEDDADRAIGGINVSSLLRQRLATTPPPTPDREDDEWDTDKNTTNEPVPPPATDSSSNPIEAAEEPPANEGLRCVALYSYEKTEDDELGFEEHEIITHVEKRHEDWWFGKIGDRSGVFPVTYVEELP